MSPDPEPVLKSRRRADVDTTVVAVRDVRFGDGSYPVVAGPVAVEDEQQITTIADAAAEAGASVLRAGTFRAETSPYTFKGLGAEGLWLLEKAGHEAHLPTMTEVIEPGHVDLVADHVDVLEVGPDNMQNFVLLQAAGRTGRPVLIHRAAAATVDEWLMAAEYVLAEGNERVVLCERGSRTFDPRTSDTIDISVVPVVQRLSHLPVIIDPAPTAGVSDILRPLALAGRSAGADGLIVSVHPDPDTAIAGNGNQLGLTDFAQLMEALGIPSLRDEIDRIDRHLIRLVADRLKGSVEIARIKSARGIPLRSPLREAELVAEARELAVRHDVDPDYVEALMTMILDHSRAAQRDAVGGSEASAAEAGS
ncbi:MAG: bifunctional 3-deoxy-7-phosphoheptulonate synthase/chorismate mutase [Acidimicrobiia bacterium]